MNKKPDAARLPLTSGLSASAGMPPAMNDRNLKSGLQARPHPSPLPRERGNSADANQALEFSSIVRALPLSSGERAGVRAGLSLTFRGADYSGASISGQGVRGPLLQRVENRITNRLALATQPRVPETQFLDPKGLEELGSFCIGGLSNRMAMLESVELNRQPGLLAEEVQNVFSGGMLASELVAGETPVPQPTPNEFLRPSGFLAERAGEVGAGHRGEPTPAERNRKNGLHARPHPGPLPQERGRRSRRLWKPTRPGVRAPSGRKGSNATDATEAIELSSSARQFSLSLGERAGVRASRPSPESFRGWSAPGGSFHRAEATVLMKRLAGA
jgi:hypothetical protein